MLRTSNAFADLQVKKEETRMVFDGQTALAQVDGDQVFLRELAELFVQECPGWLAEVAAALAQKESPLVQQAAHKLKGAACSFAADRTIAAAQRLESAAAAGDLEAAQLGYRDLACEVERLLASLKRLILCG